MLTHRPATDRSLPEGSLPELIRSVTEMPQPPTHDQLLETNRAFGLGGDADEIQEYAAVIEGMLATYSRLDQLHAPKLPVRYARTQGQVPPREGNALGAWAQKCAVDGAASGPLSGRSVVLKDNISLAGIGMRNGSSTLDGYVPDEDATVATRLLDAGATIVGKAVCESFCLSGASHTSAVAPVRNPHDPTRSTGGSSSGCAALVASGEVDLAIGSDQGGSVRMPAGWSGIYGHKPTWGLVPYTGAATIDLTLDTLGPMARSVEDLALAMDAIAGRDGLDPRQGAGLRVEPYFEALNDSVEGLRVGVVAEGFGWPGASEPDVDELVREAAFGLKDLGCVVEDVSIAMHREAATLALPLFVEGSHRSMTLGMGAGVNFKGHYPVGLIDAVGRGIHAHGADLSVTHKLYIYVAEYMQAKYHGRYYALAQNLTRTLQADYDKAFGEYDVLLMPTLPMKATSIPGPDADVAQLVAAALGMVQNACAFNLTGHPATAVPIGMSDGLPVSMMIAAPHWEDARLLRLAHAWQTGIAGAEAPIARYHSDCSLADVLGDGQ